MTYIQRQAKDSINKSLHALNNVVLSCCELLLVISNLLRRNVM